MNRSKPPKRTVKSDSFKVDQDGESYFPHAGESVTFKGRGSVRSAMTAMSLSRLSDLPSEKITTAMDPDGIMGKVLHELADNIHSWTWTDPDGEPYPERPDRELLAGLEFGELAWLLSAMAGNEERATEEERKND